MIKIAICDDEEIFINEICKIITQYFKEKNIEFEIHCFNSGKTLLEDKDVFECEIAFLDIHFGDAEQNGIEIGKTLKIISPTTKIIYISNLIEYAPEGYEVSALGYILKNKLATTLPRYLDRIVNQYFDKFEHLSLEKNGDIENVSLLNIEYIESLRHEIVVHVINDEHSPYKLRTTLQKLEQELCEKGFLRIHKSFLINMRMITDFRNYNVIINKTKIINVNSRNWKAVTNAIIKWRSKV